MFSITLMLHTKWSFEYIESLPLSKFKLLKAYYSIHPFGNHVESLERGVIAAETVNARVLESSDIRRPSDLFGWLKDPTERFIEPEMDSLATQRSIMEAFGESPEEIAEWGQQQSLEKGAN